MCESCDVLQSSYQAANAMTNSFCDYGNGSMGYGIRKFADEMFDAGTKEGYKIGCSDGYSVGFLEGTIVTTAILGTVGFTVWGVKKLVSNYKAKKERENATIEKELNGKEVIYNA